MKVKKEYIALAVVLAALVVYLAVDQTGRVHYELPELPTYPDTEITRIRIEQPEGMIDLEKEDDQWRISPAGWRADPKKIKTLTGTIRNLQVTALVSEGGNYPTYSLGDQRRIHVAAWADGKQIRAFDVGKTAPTYKHTFVRLPDDPRVYHASGNFRKHFADPAAQLRDKTVMAFEQSAVEQIRIETGGTVKTIARSRVQGQADTATESGAEKSGPASNESGKYTWTDAKGNTVSADRISGLLGKVSGLKCRDYLSDTDRKDLAEPVYTLRLTTDDAEHVLNIYPKAKEEEKTYPAASSHVTDPFTLSQSRAEAIMNLLSEQTEAAQTQNPKAAP